MNVTNRKGNSLSESGKVFCTLRWHLELTGRQKWQIRLPEKAPHFVLFINLMLTRKKLPNSTLYHTNTFRNLKLLWQFMWEFVRGKGEWKKCSERHYGMKLGRCWYFDNDTWFQFRKIYVPKNRDMLCRKCGWSVTLRIGKTYERCTTVFSGTVWGMDEELLKYLEKKNTHTHRKKYVLSNFKFVGTYKPIRMLHKI